MIIVSGLSGSGKSIVLQTLEDFDYYCVDNLPIKLLQPFAEDIQTREGGRFETTAVCIDARNFKEELKSFSNILYQLRSNGLNVEILFLRASDEVLLKRYSETRRKHPLSLDGITLLEAIQRERQLLEPIAAHADLIMDTSHTNIYELRKLVKTRLHVHDNAQETLSILFLSFGFKNGIPDDADFIFDVRCLPNPHWEPQLRHLTGLDDRVIEFLNRQPEVNNMIADLRRFLDTWIPRFEAGTRSYLTIAVGCTGGQHRSVFVASKLACYFRRTRNTVMTRHRELK
jgi:UPF0042 nucleotide-binding protein